MRLACRAYATHDLPQLLDLWVESWSEVDATIDFNTRRGWFTDHIAAWIREGKICRVIMDDPAVEILGFILLDSASGHLDQICVAAPCKGQGVGEALMQEARKLSAHGLHLEVNAMNHRAIRFYQRQGFTKTGEGFNPRSGLPIHHYHWRP